MSCILGVQIEKKKEEEEALLIAPARDMFSFGHDIYGVVPHSQITNTSHQGSNDLSSVSHETSQERLQDIIEDLRELFKDELEHPFLLFFFSQAMIMQGYLP